MNAFVSPHAREIGRQYDLFQTSLELIEKQRKFLNYGYTVSRKQSYEERQERLCLEVFESANIHKENVLIDVGFGSGEQDFLLAKTFEFERLVGFNVSERQVRYAAQRAKNENLTHRLSFRVGEAELLPGVDDASVDKILAIECALYFDRPRFYQRAAQVLKPGGLVVLADISFSRHLAILTKMAEHLRRVGTRSCNRKEWEKHFLTRSQRNINAPTRPGAQMTVVKILRFAPSRGLSGAERREWLSMAFFTQLIALGLMVGLMHYDLIVLEKR
jgi:ubiquinone/menaquinone biosynthesis C-methylase UbiE